ANEFVIIVDILKIPQEDLLVPKVTSFAIHAGNIIFIALFAEKPSGNLGRVLIKVLPNLSETPLNLIIMEINFDVAIEILEITNVNNLKIDDIPDIEKKAKKRWHPDRVAHLNDPMLTEEYTEKYQKLEQACQLLSSFLKGEYHIGEPFTQKDNRVYEEPEDVIRKNAQNIQETIRGLWNVNREKKYKWSEKEVLLSDGFKLKNLLSEDFKEDIAMLSIISFFYGIISFGLLTLVGFMINPGLGILIELIWAAQALSCILGFLPLSRLWLPQSIQPIIIWFINFGLGVYNWAEEQAQNSSNSWIILLVRIPVLFAKVIKYIFLFPLYEITKAIVGDKVLGVVNRKVDYYAEAAEWYIDDLILLDPNDMTTEELFHLSYIYSELSDVKSKT
ncbi:MAG: hypothetical protein WCF67_21410, partial [Chitinophagaceae bacterium]